MKATKQITCPLEPADHPLAGCGSNNLAGPDDEGWYDCCDCGIFFSPAVDAAFLVEASK